MDTILSFEKSLRLHGKPATLGQLTPQNVRTWVADQRSGTLPSGSSRPAAACSDQTIRPRHAALTSFSRKFILKELKLTHRDLLEEVERFEKELPTKKPLSQEEIAAIRACFSLPTFEHVRDRAIFEVHMATAFRFRHSFGQGMARAGASIADIRDVLGHESDKMARHYAGEARKVAAANLMTKYSLAG